MLPAQNKAGDCGTDAVILRLDPEWGDKAGFCGLMADGGWVMADE